MHLTCSESELQNTVFTGQLRLNYSHLIEQLSVLERLAYLTVIDPNVATSFVIVITIRLFLTNLSSLIRTCTKRFSFWQKFSPSRWRHESAQKDAFKSRSPRATLCDERPWFGRTYNRDSVYLKKFFFHPKEHWKQCFGNILLIRKQFESNYSAIVLLSSTDKSSKESFQHLLVAIARDCVT